MMMIRTAMLLGAALPTLLTAQAEPTPGPYARIATMRALDGHGWELEQGYLRHLDWHRGAKDTYGWYSYSFWASNDRQRWIMYATFGHTAASLSNPVSPAEDEQNNVLNVLPHARFMNNGVYEFLPALSHGNGVPTPTPRAEYTTVVLIYGAGKAFETALALEQPKLRGETLWYRMVLGGDTPCYVRIRPRESLGAILDERADQALPDKVTGLVMKMTVETLNLRPNMLVNVTPPEH
jgi:hypothetical protein